MSEFVNPPEIPLRSFNRERACRALRGLADEIEDGAKIMEGGLIIEVLSDSDGFQYLNIRGNLSLLYSVPEHLSIEDH